MPSNTKRGENSVPHPEVPGRPCSAAAALQLVGERWALLAIREIFYGNQRFDQIARNTGAPATVSRQTARTGRGGRGRAPRPQRAPIALRIPAHGGRPRSRTGDARAAGQ